MRKKRGFGVPNHIWLKEAGQDYFNHILNKETIRERGYFKYKYVKKLIEKSKNQSYMESNKLWSLVALELWQMVSDTFGWNWDMDFGVFPDLINRCSI